MKDLGEGGNVPGRLAMFPLCNYMLILQYYNIHSLKNRIEEREKERQAMTWQQQLHHLTNRCKKNSGGGGGGGSGRADKPEKPTWDLTPNLLTPAMEEVIKMRSKRVSVEIDVPITPEPSDGESDSEEEEEEEEESIRY